jgi:multiple sugar transport system permease protein
MRAERRRKRALLWLGGLSTAIFCLAPFLLMALTGLASRAAFLQKGAHLHLTLTHWHTVLTGEFLHFPAYLRNSLAVAGISATLTVLVAALAAYAFTRLPLPGRRALLLIVLALSMFPPVSLLGYLFRFMTALRWIDTWQALILPYIAWSLPLSLWILISYFMQIPVELDQAALVDGCSRRQALLRIILPVAAPGIFATGLLAFVFAFNEFLFALMLTTGPRARTVPVGIAFFEGLHGEVPWGEIMAAATLTTLPVVVLTLVFQRRIMQGLTRGAIKG